MFKIVIIEDEDIIRRGIINMINWTSINCQIVGEAANGAEGLKLIESLKPDIVLLDINMPIMNGIEMLEALPRDVFSTIILSGQSEFEYAKKAISYDVCDYLLKPIMEDVLINSIEKAKKQMQMKRSYLAETQSDPFKVLDLDYRTDSITLKKAIAYIEENFASKITMDDLVAVTEKSQTSINKRFQRDYGMTFNEYLTKYRIEMALKYIKGLDFQLYEIAELVGFSDYKYFNNVFKKTVGESPRMVQLYYLRNNI